MIFDLYISKEPILTLWIMREGGNTGSFLGNMNASRCPAVQAKTCVVIDASLRRVQHGHCDFFSGCRERPINQL